MATKGIAAMHVVVMTIFMVLLVLMLTYLSTTNNAREQAVLLRELDILAVSSLHRFAVESLRTSWSVIGTQVAFDALEGRFGLGREWYAGRAGAAGEAGGTPLPGAATPALANGRLQAGLENVSLPDSFELHIKEGRVREVKRNILLKASGHRLAANWQDVAGSVEQALKINGKRPSQVDASFPIQINVPISLLAMGLASLQAVSTSTELKARSLGRGLAYDERSRQADALQGVNGPLETEASLATGVAEASLLSPASFHPSERLKASADGSALALAYTNSVTIFGGRTRAVSGMARCGAAGGEARRMELLYNRYAGAIERAYPDSLLAYVKSPRAYIAAAIDAVSGWDPGYNKGRTITTGDPVGLLARAGQGERLFEPGENILAGVGKLEEAFAAVSGLGVSGEDLLEAGYAAFVDRTATEAAIQAAGGKWAEARTRLPGYVLDQAAAVAGKYRTWQQCEFSRPLEFPASAFHLTKPVERITAEESIAGGQRLPPTLVTFYGDPTGRGWIPQLASAFSHAIEIRVAPGEEVKAAADGRATFALPFERWGFPRQPRSVAFRQPDANGVFYWIVYGNVEQSLSEGQEVRAGDVIGKAGEEGLLRFGIIDARFNSINPCIYLGCYSFGQAEASSLDATLPKTSFEVYSPLDYANFLSKRAGKKIRLGEEVCSLWNRARRGLRSLAYRFYSQDGEPFAVWPVYEGVVERVDADDTGCNSAVFVRSGDFITVYGGLSSLNLPKVGDKVALYPKVVLASVRTVIGSVARKEACPNSHLRVSFAPLTFEIGEPSNPRLFDTACGTAIPDCNQGSNLPFSCDNTKGTCRQKGAGDFPNLFVPPHACSALEWEATAVRKSEPLLWRERAGRRAFERQGPELNFFARDELALFTCPATEARPLNLVDEKELLCAGGKLHACGLALEGAINLQDGSRVDADGDGANDGQQDYLCRNLSISAGELNGIIQGPGTAARARQYYEGRVLSRFCKPGDENEDWFCCTYARKGIFNCRRWEFKDGRLRCAEFQPNKEKCAPQSPPQ